MWLIVPRLYLGDYRSGHAALAGAELPAHPSEEPSPFTGVVSLCPVPLFPGEPVVDPASKATEWLELPIHDGGFGDEEFVGALDAALPFIRRQMLRGNVLVHCAAGMSRSVSVIAAVLCETGLGVEEAFQRIAQRKTEALKAQDLDTEWVIAPAWEFQAVLRRRFKR